MVKWSVIKWVDRFVVLSICSVIISVVGVYFHVHSMVYVFIISSIVACVLMFVDDLLLSSYDGGV